MMAHVLVAGTLFRAPEQRTSKAGNPFVTATIRLKDGEAFQWWNVLAFPDDAGGLQRLLYGAEVVGVGDRAARLEVAHRALPTPAIAAS